MCHIHVKKQMIMHKNALKETEKKLIAAEKENIKLKQSLQLGKEKLQEEKQKNKSLSDKLSRRNQSQTVLKDELTQLKKNVRFHL